MASEEKYLWTFTYRLHGTDYIWWAYFRDRQEAEAEIAALQAAFPCLQAQSLQEARSGLMFAHYYYHHASSSQRRAGRHAFPPMHERTIPSRAWNIAPCVLPGAVMRHVCHFRYLLKQNDTCYNRAVNSRTEPVHSQVEAGLGRDIDRLRWMSR